MSRTTISGLALLVLVVASTTGSAQQWVGRGYYYAPPRYYMTPPVYYHPSVFAPPVIEVHPVPVVAPVWLEPVYVPPPLPYRPVAPVQIFSPRPRIVVAPAAVYYEVEVRPNWRRGGVVLEYEFDD